MIKKMVRRLHPLFFSYFILSGLPWFPFFYLQAQLKGEIVLADTVANHPPSNRVIEKTSFLIRVAISLLYMSGISLFAELREERQ